jgi:hypothetical protein
VYVWRFATFLRIEEKAELVDAKNCWHPCSYLMMPRWLLAMKSAR